MATRGSEYVLGSIASLETKEKEVPFVPTDAEKASLKNQITRIVNSLPDELRRYYGSHSNEPRVQEFMNWFSANKETLLKGFLDDYAKGKIAVPIKSTETAISVFGLWLGSRYVSSLAETKFGRTTTPNYPPITHKVPSAIWGVGGNAFAAYDAKTHSLGIGSIVEKFNDPSYVANLPSHTGLLIMMFNTGIHEATHGLARTFGVDKTLAESATFYTGRYYRLPLKKEDIASLEGAYGHTLRDFPSNFEQLKKEGFPASENMTILMTEYFEYIVGPWISKFLGSNADIFSFEDTKEPLNLSELFWRAKINQDPEYAKLSREKSMTELADIISARFNNTEISEGMRKLFTWIESYFVNQPPEFANAMETITDSKASAEDRNKAAKEMGKFLIELVKKMDEIFGPADPLSIPPDYARLDLNTIPRKTDTASTRNA